MRTRTLLVVAAFAAAAAGSGCASTGQERAERLSDRIDETRAAVDAHGASRQAAFDSKSVLTAEPLENLTAKFEAFDASVNGVSSAEGDLRSAFEKMKSSADKRFRAWGEENVSYGDPDMQVSAQRSRAEATEMFRRAVVDLDAMLEQSAGFVAYLSDLRKILSNELTPAGIASVADYSAKARVSSERLDVLAQAIRTSLGAVSESMSSR